uniref:licodione synthase-like isoform X2 n=1 Tax=Fragaria vesca subsp. vesca TaxID=101020 RepID=UPI0005C90089|nr:PREDICTED: licodione synthase-like isoform X2 [Fragaria vesca subsp. vesca]XP_011466602.1 PREDICTED: licodione synthase-like isoform X2 [Fragaria vesca subsp. vesca]XP_011466603.1 PREDICTED: licodione synthase-like isoform X2 [Fragaria vesca subsp. vesca]XP_011466604.1 PREDICTED: licodione synthase-like isoform X2 [Fragaria vesca subsp. vesca]
MWQKGHQHHRFERGRAQPCFFLNIAVTRASFTTGYISLAFLSFVLYTQFVRTVLCMMAWKKIKIMENHAQGKSQDLFTASTDTTAIAMEWALAELINHPAVLEKPREEIDRVVGNERIVEESDGSTLPYIQAIIKETFRLHPHVPMVTRISVEDYKVGEYVIPTNTILFVNNWAIGRDPKNWEKPLDFWPERFLEGGDQITGMDVRGQLFQFLPFGSERRICPGINLTMKMVPSLVAAMIQCFDWKVIPSKKMNNNDCVVEMDERPGLTTPRAHDLVCFPVACMHLLNILKP